MSSRVVDKKLSALTGNVSRYLNEETYIHFINNFTIMMQWVSLKIISPTSPLIFGPANTSGLIVPDNQTFLLGSWSVYTIGLLRTLLPFQSQLNSPIDEGRWLRCLQYDARQIDVTSTLDVKFRIPDYFSFWDCGKKIVIWILHWLVFISIDDRRYIWVPG